MFSGAKLKRARIDAGLSQEQLAKRVGVTARAVAFWEAGDRQPRGHLIRRIALATEKPIDFFLSDDNGMAA